MPPKQPPRRGTSSASSRQSPTTNANTTAPGPSSNSTSSTNAGPTRQPVQRLQSLKRTAPAGSIAPAAAPAARSSATPGPGTGAGAGAGDQPSKPTLKYKPRAVGRRSKEERDAIEQVEAQRHHERVQEAAAIQRGRGGGGVGASGRGGTRGRGGPVGGGHGNGNGNIGGPLGSGMSGGARRGRGGGVGGRFGPGAGAAGQDSRASSMTQRSRTRSVIDMGMGMGGSGAASRDVSSDESDSGVLVDINQINLDSDEEGFDEALEKKMKKKGKGKGPVADAADTHGEKSLRPIRVERHEHAERVVSVNMESSSSKSAELRQQAMAKAKGDDDLLFVPQDADTEQQQPRVKDEPTDDGDQVMRDVPAAAAAADDGLLPEQTVKVRRKLDKEPPSATTEPAAKDPKSLLRTKEDIEEYERHEQDLEVVKGLLSVEPKESKQKQPEQPVTEGDTAAEAAEDDVSAEAEAEEDTEREKLSGQLFLMQFPPMTPNLVVPGTAAADGVDGTEQAEATATVAPPDAEPSQPNEQTTVKREDDAAIDLDAAADSPDAPPPKLVTATNQQLPAGRVGKLNVHASGRVTMDWGGISFELDKATDVDFLQEALVLSTTQNQQQHEAGVKMEELEETEEKKAWAMGQLSGKFTVTPDWAGIL